MILPPLETLSPRPAESSPKALLKDSRAARISMVAAALLAAAACLGWVASAVAQPSQPAAASSQGDSSAAGDSVIPATYETPNNQVVSAAERITFAARPPQVGDVAEQQITVELTLNSVIRQSGQTIDSSKSTMIRRQRRTVTTTELAEGRAVAARIRFETSAKDLTTNGKAAETATDPVAGKTYLCRREGEELKITDPSGNVPPPEELELVAVSMASLGQPHPLAKFLAGRSIAVGEKISLPREAAEQLLGLADDTGQVSRFELTLREVKSEKGALCGVFTAELEAASHEGGQLRMLMDGRLTIERDSCRILSAQIAGPIGMAESHGGAGMSYHVSATGRLSVGIESQHRDAGVANR